MPEIGAGEVSAAGPATCAAYAPVTSAAAAKVSQHRLIARSGGSGRELASNRDPPRFPCICLNRRLESSLGGVPIGADRDPAMRTNKRYYVASATTPKLASGNDPTTFHREAASNVNLTMESNLADLPNRCPQEGQIASMRLFYRPDSSVGESIGFIVKHCRPGAYVEWFRDLKFPQIYRC